MRCSAWVALMLCCLDAITPSSLAVFLRVVCGGMVQVACSTKTCERIGVIKTTAWGGVDNPITSHGYGAGASPS